METRYEEIDRFYAIMAEINLQIIKLEGIITKDSSKEEKIKKYVSEEKFVTECMIAICLREQGEFLKGLDPSVLDKIVLNKIEELKKVSPKRASSLEKYLEPINEAISIIKIGGNISYKQLEKFYNFLKNSLPTIKLLSRQVEDSMSLNLTEIFYSKKLLDSGLFDEKELQEIDSLVSDGKEKEAFDNIKVIIESKKSELKEELKKEKNSKKIEKLKKGIKILIRYEEGFRGFSEVISYKNNNPKKTKKRELSKTGFDQLPNGKRTKADRKPSETGFELTNEGTKAGRKPFDTFISPSPNPVVNILIPAAC